MTRWAGSLRERTIESPFAHVRARLLYTAWSRWCEATGEERGSEVEFSRAMEARGFEKADRKVGRVWLGLGLAAYNDDETAGQSVA